MHHSYGIGEDGVLEPCSSSPPRTPHLKIDKIPCQAQGACILAAGEITLRDACCNIFDCKKQRSHCLEEVRSAFLGVFTSCGKRILYLSNATVILPQNKCIVKRFFEIEGGSRKMSFRASSIDWSAFKRTKTGKGLRALSRSLSCKELCFGDDGSPCLINTV